MKLESIVLLRTQFQDSGIKIFAQNGLLFNSKSDHTNLVWDDTNGLLYAFRPNNSHYNQDKRRLSVDAINYDDFEMISTEVTREQLSAILGPMKVAGTVTDEVINDILKSYDSLNNKLL